MNRLTARLPVLRKAIIPPGGSGPVRMAEIGDPLIRAIARKAKFATCTWRYSLGSTGNATMTLGGVPQGTPNLLR